MTDYKSMFEQAVRTLAAIDEALGIGDDGCCDPDQTLTAIAELKAKVGAGKTAQAVAQNVFAFPATVTMTPEQALLSALEFTRTGNMQDVLVVGYDGDGRLVVRSSRMDRKEALWLSEQARRHALGDVA